MLQEPDTLSAKFDKWREDLPYEGVAGGALQEIASQLLLIERLASEGKLNGGQLMEMNTRLNRVNLAITDVILKSGTLPPGDNAILLDIQAYVTKTAADYKISLKDTLPKEQQTTMASAIKKALESRKPGKETATLISAEDFHKHTGTHPFLPRLRELKAVENSLFQFNNMDKGKLEAAPYYLSQLSKDVDNATQALSKKSLFGKTTKEDDKRLVALHDLRSQVNEKMKEYGIPLPEQKQDKVDTSLKYSRR